MSQAAAASGEAHDAAVITEAATDERPETYNRNLHVQLRATARESEEAVGLVEQHIADLQESLDQRRDAARAAADELAAYQRRFPAENQE